MRELKKILILTMLLIIAFVNTNFVFADDEDEELDYSFVYEDIIDVMSDSTKEPDILSRSAVVLDRETNEVIWGKKEDVKVPMASTTKILTATILLENGDLKQVVTVDKKAAAIGGSRLGLKIGDKITLHDLLYGLMLCSRK